MKFTSQMPTLFLDQESYVELPGLKDPRTDAFVNDADVEVVIKDRQNNILTGPHAMDYQAGSDGVYIGTVPTLDTAFDGQRVIVEVTATSGDGHGRLGKWKEPAIYDTRRATDVTCC